MVQLKCIKCGEATNKDVRLLPADAQMVVPAPSPTASAAATIVCYVRYHCYPTCYNSAHIVRKVSGN